MTAGGGWTPPGGFTMGMSSNPAFLEGPPSDQVRLARMERLREVATVVFRIVASPTPWLILGYAWGTVWYWVRAMDGGLYPPVVRVGLDLSSHAYGMFWLGGYLALGLVAFVIAVGVIDQLAKGDYGRWSDLDDWIDQHVMQARKWLFLADLLAYFVAAHFVALTLLWFAPGGLYYCWTLEAVGFGLAAAKGVRDALAFVIATRINTENTF